MFEPAAVAAASKETTPVARLGVAVPPVPKPEQVALVSAYPAGIPSVIVVAVEVAVSV